jgi:hypothetical protein
MTHTEYAYIAAFLGRLSERMSNDGCNDMFLADTPENRELVKAAEHETVGPGETWQPMLHGGKLCTSNYMVVEHVKDKLMQEQGIKEDELPEDF